jgi:aryl-alcohol dehydrogenase-like predicted oxidoreductase
MKYHLLGNSGLRVSELCLGTMTFGETWGWGDSPDGARRQMQLFAEAGGNFIDTAILYTDGESEKIIGEIVAPNRDKWVIATKYTFNNTGAEDVNSVGNHRKNIMRSVDISLQRMKTDYIDLYDLHGWDFTTPVEEVMRAFDDLVRAGKVLYPAVSDTPAWIIARANMLAELRAWSPFICLQTEYSLVERTSERDLLPMAQSCGLGITAWSPLAQGVLSGKYNAQRDAAGRLTRDAKNPYLNDRNLQIAGEVVRVAKECGHSPAQVALRWMMQKPGRIIPIVGARKAEQLEDTLKVVEFELGGESLAQLDAASAITLGFPHDFLAGDTVNNFALGGSIKRLSTTRKAGI